MKDKYPSETIRQITEFLFIEDPIDSIPPADLVIVFGSEFIKGSVDALEQLTGAGVITRASKVILSGATGSINAGMESEAVRMYNEALSRGMAKETFTVEDKATNSYQNLEYSKDIISGMGGFDRFESILFVGKSFMLKRTKMCAAGLGYPVDRIKYFGLVDREGRNIARDCWWEREESRTRVLQEVERIGKYAAKGDLSIF